MDLIESTKIPLDRTSFGWSEKLKKLSYTENKLDSQNKVKLHETIFQHVQKLQHLNLSNHKACFILNASIIVDVQ